MKEKTMGRIVIGICIAMLIWLTISFVNDMKQGKYTMPCDLYEESVY